jgi:hypothetical protein
MNFLLHVGPRGYDDIRENNQLNLHSDFWTYYDWQANPGAFVIRRWDERYANARQRAISRNPRDVYEADARLA